MQLCASLSIFWHFLSLGLEWKLNFSNPVAPAEFSKFAGILSATLWQHHLLEPEIAQLEFHHLHWLCSSWCFLRPTWLPTPECLALGKWSHHPGYLGHEGLFCIAWFRNIKFLNLSRIYFYLHDEYFTWVFPQRTKYPNTLHTSRHILGHGLICWLLHHYHSLSVILNYILCFNTWRFSTFTLLFHVYFSYQL